CKSDGRCLPRKTLSATAIASSPEIRTSAIAASPAAVEIAAIVSSGTIERFTPGSSRTGIEITGGFHHRHVISISYSHHAATDRISTQLVPIQQVCRFSPKHILTFTPLFHERFLAEV